jgi:hypothetical protein
MWLEHCCGTCRVVGRSSKLPSQRAVGFRLRRGTLAAADRADCCGWDIAEAAMNRKTVGCC